LTSKKRKAQKKKPVEEEKASEKEEAPQDQEPLKEAPVPVVPQIPQNPLESLTYPFRVIVSPLKTFQRIAAYPDIKGFVVVIGLFLLVSVGAQYTLASKLVLTINAQPVNLVTTTYLQDTLISGTFYSLLPFILGWLIFAGLLLVITNITGTKGGRLRQFLVIAGYAFTVFVIRTAITAVLISTLPQVNLSLPAPPVTEAEWTDYYNQINAVWSSLLATQALPIFNYIIDAWLAILTAVGVRVFQGVSWSRAATISATSYLIYLTIRLFLGLVL